MAEQNLKPNQEKKIAEEDRLTYLSLLIYNSLFAAPTSFRAFPGYVVNMWSEEDSVFYVDSGMEIHCLSSNLNTK